jgi:diguanylate cyclase (GGDEF)-like protein
MPKTSDTRYSDDELQHRANYDYLTGVYNRHYLNEICGEINKKHNIGITFVDINGLKTTNDTLGHLAGDKLIKRVSNIICSVYESSMVFRIGGDEFVIITTGVDEKTFKEMSEKGRKIFEGENLAAMGCQFYEKIDDISCCIEHCDFLMYEHKKAMKQYAYANA